MLPELIVKKVTSLPTTIVPYMGTDETMIDYSSPTSEVVKDN